MTMMQQSSLPEMITQSREIIQSPSIAAFERYEQRGTMTNAAIYIGVAALIAAVLGLVSSFLPGPPPAGFSGFFSGLFGALAQFFIFTGMVYFLGKTLFNGTGTWDEVAYTFSLFSAPLIVLGALLSFVVTVFSWLPVINLLVGMVVGIVKILLLLVQVYYAYIGVQSSMNLRNPIQAGIVLLSGFISSVIVIWLVSSIF